MNLGQAEFEAIFPLIKSPSEDQMLTEMSVLIATLDIVSELGRNLASRQS